MNKNNLVCYYTDNFIYFYNDKNNNLYEDKLINIVFESRIIDIDNFYKQLVKILKKYKLNSNLVASDITIITPVQNTKTDDYILINIFEKLGFNKIKLKKEKELINIKNNQAIIRIDNNSYTYFYLNKNKKIRYIVIPYSIFISNKNLELINSILEYNYKLNISKNYFLGEKKQLDIIIDKLEKKSKINCFIYEEGNRYLLDQFVERNTD